MLTKQETETRRANIISRWKTGVSQQKLAEEYGVTQTRISTIIYRKMPPYRYCNYCKKQINIDLHTVVCDECNLVVREKRIEVLLKIKTKFAQEKASVLYMLNELNELIVERELFEKRLAKELKIDFMLLRQKERYERKVKCVFCDGETELSSKVCFICCPYARELKISNLTGRDRVRSLVRARDRYKCQNCGLIRRPEEVKEHNKNKKGLMGKMKSLDVHHIGGLCGKSSKGYDKAEMLPKLISLCHKCHYNRHDHTLNSRKH